nr:glycosyl hydrolase family 28 protein [Allomuricauda sp.]
MKNLLNAYVTVLVLFISCNQAKQKTSTVASASFLNDSDGAMTHLKIAEGLSDIHGLSQSDIFSASLNGEEAFVYKSIEIRDKNEHKKQGNSVSYDGVSYLSFSISDPISLQILKGDSSFAEWKVMPEINSAVRKEGNTITISLEKPQKFVVSSKIGEKEHYLIVSAEEPETDIPDKEDKSVLFLEPGIYKYGQAWDPFVDGIKTLYIARGAVVEATIKAKNKKGVKILGRGILSQSFVTHAEESSKEEEWDADWLGVVFIDSEDIEIDGVAIMSSPSYQLEVANCNDVKINNVKLCGFGEHNNDGLHTYSTNVEVTDSFIASNDDRICITGLYDAETGNDELSWDGSNQLKGVPVSNIFIKDIVFWGLDNNGGDIMLTWNGADYAKDITIENTVSLTPSNKAFIAARHGGSADINNLNIKNVKLMHGNLFDIEIGKSNFQGAGGGKIRNMTLENVEIDAGFNAIGKQLIGESEVSNIEGLTLINIMTKEGKLENLNQINITRNDYVSNITIK